LGYTPMGALLGELPLRVPTQHRGNLPNGGKPKGPPSPEPKWMEDSQKEGKVHPRPRLSRMGIGP